MAYEVIMGLSASYAIPLYGRLLKLEQIFNVTFNF